MNLEDLRGLFPQVKDFAMKRSPEIFTALGIGGFVTTVVLTAKASPKVEASHYGYTVLRRQSAQTKEERIDLWKDEVKELAPVVIPPVISGVASIGFVLAAHRIQAKRAATLATAYSLAERTLSAYQEKALEKLGDEGAVELMQAVSDKLAQDDCPFDEDYSYSPDEDGKCLCYDRVTGRYFRSTPDEIKAAEGAINKRLIDESVVHLSDFYYELDLDFNGFVCDALGWDISKDRLDIYFTSMLDRYERPCLVLNYNVNIVDRRVFEGRR